MYWYGFTENSVPFIKGLEPCGVPAGARVSLFTTTAMAAAYGTDQGSEVLEELVVSRIARDRAALGRVGVVVEVGRVARTLADLGLRSQGRGRVGEGGGRRVREIRRVTGGGGAAWRRIIS